MKLRLVIILLMCVSFVHAQESQTPDEFFKNSTLVSFDDKTSPEDIIGALVFYKDKDKTDWQYVNLYSISDLKKIEPIENQEIIYQDMVKHDVVTSINYLKIFSAEVKKQNLLQVVLTDQYDLKVDSFLSNVQVKKKVLDEARALHKKGYHVEYVDKVNQTDLTTKLFEKNEVKAGINYVASGSQENYTEANKFKLKKLVSVHSVSLDPWLTKDKDKSALDYELHRVPGRSYIPKISTK